MAEKKGKNALKRSAAGLAGAFVMLVAASFTWLGKSLGWFSENRETGADGANVGVTVPDVTETLQYSYDGLAWTAVPEGFSFENLVPGDKVMLRLTMQNPSASALFADVSFLAPDGCETPVSDGTYNYYLGSQIAVAAVDGGTVQVTADTRLLDISGFVAEGSDFGVLPEDADSLAPTDILLTEGVPLPAGGSAAVTVTLQFVNADFDQSVLKNFGTGGGVCFRRLDAAYSYQ